MPSPQLAGSGAPKSQRTAEVAGAGGEVRALTVLIIPPLGKHQSTDNRPGTALGTGDSARVGTQRPALTGHMFESTRTAGNAQTTSEREEGRE